MTKQGSNPPILSVLKKAGFDSQMLVYVLEHDGGSHNLDALKGLLQGLVDINGDPLMDNETKQQSTYLSVLKKADFDSEMLVCVLRNNGGSLNLNALKGLLQGLVDSNKKALIDDETGQQSTYLSVLKKAGFDSQMLVCVLEHNGGSRNLDALKGLLQGLVDTNGDALIDDETGQQSTYLSVLKKAGFDSQMLVSVLGHGGGSLSLKALIDLTKNSDIRAFIATYDKAPDIITDLAKQNSRLAHLLFLSDILSKEPLRTEIIEKKLLKDCCAKIKKLSAKDIKNLKIENIEELVEFCNGQHNVQIGNKRKQTDDKPTTRKRSKTTETLSLSTLITYLSSGESNRLHFKVEPLVAQEIKKIDKAIQKEMGIKTIRKIRDKDKYEITLTELATYKKFLDKHSNTPRPFVEDTPSSA